MGGRLPLRLLLRWLYLLSAGVACSVIFGTEPSALALASVNLDDGMVTVNTNI
jgi:hypothetical protein